MSLANRRSSLSDFRIPFFKLGAGSFGTVFKVLRKVDSKTYVLKQIKLADLTRKQKIEAINEVKILASLDSPYVVRYYDSFLDNASDSLNIVMEYCDRGDLSAHLKKRQDPLREKRVWSVFIQICLGLRYLHSKRVLHRDMKPANVFLCKNEKIKVGDLGVARVLGSSTNFAKTMCGTPYYMSPELCEDKPYNAKSDVWSLGCILYECCTLEHPFDARNQGALILKIMNGKFKPISTDIYSKGLQQITALLLSRSPHARPTMASILSMPLVSSRAKELGICIPEGFAEKNYGKRAPPPPSRINRQSAQASGAFDNRRTRRAMRRFPISKKVNGRGLKDRERERDVNFGNVTKKSSSKVMERKLVESSFPKYEDNLHPGNNATIKIVRTKPKSSSRPSLMDLRQKTAEIAENAIDAVENIELTDEKMKEFENFDVNIQRKKDCEKLIQISKEKCEKLLPRDSFVDVLQCAEEILPLQSNESTKILLRKILSHKTAIRNSKQALEGAFEILRLVHLQKEIENLE